LLSVRRDSTGRRLEGRLKEVDASCCALVSCGSFMAFLWGNVTDFPAIHRGAFPGVARVHFRHRTG
jgi:hypothetical protein